MDRSLEIFGSRELFTLVVGPEEKKLYVGRLVIEQIPFLNTALEKDKFKEGNEGVINLPEDGAKAVADVLWFVLTNDVPSISNRATAREYVEAYVVADKFMLEKTINYLTDELAQYCDAYVIDCAWIDVLIDAHLQETKLFQFLVEQFAYTLRSHGSSGSKALDQVLTVDQVGFTDLSREGVVAVLKATVTSKSDTMTPARYAIYDPCSLHTHQLTPDCSKVTKKSRRRARYEDDDSM